jgi:tetratricopeptide (TPR) repeat protein
MNRTFTILFCLSTVAACATSSNEMSASPAGTGHAAMSMDESGQALDAPIDLLPEALGPYSWPISTESGQAQAYFDQGMQLRYAFNVDEAARTMLAAQRLDPQCAMCYWGEAFALGSYLNGAMTVEKSQRAYAAIVRAAELAPSNTSEVERDLIAAASVRYPEDYDPANRRAVDTAFAEAMAQVYEKYPDDHNVATVYAVALFMLEERRGYRDIDDPDVVRLHGVLTGVLEEDPRHPGACHLYIHATESTRKPELALPCAEYLSSAVPVASHMQHMPSHTWNEVGLWGKSVEANTLAWHSDLKAGEGRGFSYGPSHNLHMLLYAASFDGQGAVATQAGKDYRKITGNSMYEVLTLLRFGRFDEILENDRRPADEVGAALWDFARGYASLRQGDLRTAEAMRDKVLHFASTSDAMFRFHPAERLAGAVARILEGELLLDAGDSEAAISAFEKAVALEDALGYDEPEPLPFAARHWLGAALLEAERFADAERVYREELADHPNNGWSLYGLNLALEKQDRQDAEVDKEFEESWARSDTWITSSRF